MSQNKVIVNPTHSELFPMSFLRIVCIFKEATGRPQSFFQLTGFQTCRVNTRLDNIDNCFIFDDIFHRSRPGKLSFSILHFLVNCFLTEQTGTNKLASRIGELTICKPVRTLFDGSGLLLFIAIIHDPKSNYPENWRSHDHKLHPKVEAEILVDLKKEIKCALLFYLKNKSAIYECVFFVLWLCSWLYLLCVQLCELLSYFYRFPWFQTTLIKII